MSAIAPDPHQASKTQVLHGPRPFQANSGSPWWHFGLLLLGVGATATLNFVVLPLYLPLKLSLRPTALAVLAGTACSELVLLGVLLLCAHRGPGGRDRAFTVDWGWVRIAPDRTTTFGLLLAVGLALATATLIPTIRVYAFELSAFRLGAVLLAGVVGICEEFIFRGYVGSTLGRTALPTRYQIGLSALLYALFRALAWGYRFPLAVLLALALGIGWATLYRASRSLAPCLYSHLLFNLIVEPWATLWLVHHFTRDYLGPSP